VFSSKASEDPSAGLSSPPATADDGPVPFPPVFTPSIKKTLKKPAVDPGSDPIPLPEGLSAAVLKSRLDGKKKIKYVSACYDRESVS
jgi:DNA-3-methyladenine glycosylase II